MKKMFYILQLVGVMFIGLFQPVLAEDAIYTGYFSNKAVSGYDVVAYFSQQKAVKGISKYTLEYQGADWYFSNQENLSLFTKSPQRYAPQYGGYCGWAMAHNERAPGNAPYWTIYNNKLYLNYDREVQKEWRADKDNLIQQADLNWSKLEKEL